MLDHVSITVSDFAAAERFYDAIMKALEIVKVGRSDRWLGYGERADAQHPDRVYIAIYKGARPDEATSRHGASRQSHEARWTRSGAPASPPAALTMGHPASAPIMPPITARSSAIPTATRSRRCATARCSKRKEIVDRMSEATSAVVDTWGMNP